MAKVELIDLDEIHQDVIDLKIKGVLHRMVPLSVLDFVRNMQDLKKIEAGNLEDEVKVIHGMIGRAFPSIPKEEIEAFTMPMVQKLQDAIGQVMQAAEGAAKDAGGENPPQAVPLVGSTSDSSTPA
jgi:hypothetical protein